MKRHARRGSKPILGQCIGRTEANDAEFRRITLFIPPYPPLSAAENISWPNPFETHARYPREAAHKYPIRAIRLSSVPAMAIRGGSNEAVNSVLRLTIVSQAHHIRESHGERRSRMVQVHSYKRWDIARDRYVTTRLKGTPEYITSIGGEIRPNTQETIDPSYLDGQGRYDPLALRWPASEVASPNKRHDRTPG
jgi:hypothetical protein